MKVNKLLIIFLYFLFLIDILHARDFLLGDISNRNISITASFTGAEIIIYGAIDPSIYEHNNIFITVTGPRIDAKLRKKVKSLGLWVLERRYFNISNLPSYYAIASNTNQSEMEEATFILNEIGWKNIKIKLNENINIEEQNNIKEILKKIYLEKKLYVSNLNKVNIIRDTLFRSEFELPATAQVGSYEVNMYLVSKEGKELISIWSDDINVTKEGVSADLYDYSKNHPLLYGLFAAIGAIMFGFLASEIFRRI